MARRHKDALACKTPEVPLVEEPVVAASPVGVKLTRKQRHKQKKLSREPFKVCDGNVSACDKARGSQ